MLTMEHKMTNHVLERPHTADNVEPVATTDLPDAGRVLSGYLDARQNGRVLVQDQVPDDWTATDNAEAELRAMAEAMNAPPMHDAD